MKKQKPLFIPYFTSGFPDKKSFLPTIEALSEKADFIEVGVPHSDPLADGPTIQYSSKIAVDNGVNLKWVVDNVKAIPGSKKKNLKPLILFTYANPVFSYGLEKLLKDLPKPLFYGLIIPDLPLEEAKKYIPIFKKHGVNLILLVAPTTKKEKVKEIAKSSTGFIYLVSVAGVTGARESVPVDLKKKIKEIKSFTDLSIAVGFGIGNASQAKKIVSLGADGVVIGSKIISVQKEKGLSGLKKFIKTF